MPQDEYLHIVPVPSLVATLLRAERDKGEPLTEEEVVSIRDKCPSVAMTDEMLSKVVARRGYDDIDPERAWEEWQAARPSLLGGDAAAT
jgi:hypothetical protein